MKPTYVLFAIAASLLLFGCFGIGGGGQATPTPVQATPTPVHTPTAVPTQSQPQQTPQPTPVMTPVGTPTPEITPFGTPMGAGISNVEIVDFSFRPAVVTVPAGTTVTWRNMDTVHQIVSDTGLFDSDRLPQRQSWSYTFDTPGTYTYHCAIHPTMTGTVVVTP